jgi:aryl-alcohol dehydrogenase-like predicted oxidoreductase
MRTTTLGTNGPRVAALGLGCMAMSGGYGPATEADALAAIDAAFGAGIDLFDTGDFYAMGANELLLGKALKGRRGRAVVSVKFGAQRGPDGAFLGYDASPAAVKSACAHSLTRLGTDYIDIYRPARLDARVPIEETVGAIADLVAAGYVRHVGLSEVSAATVARAKAVHPIVDLQIEYSLIERGIERRTLPSLREMGVAVTAYGVLSRGLLGGRWRGAGSASPGDFRARFPRFYDENLARNLKLVDALAALAQDKGVGCAELAIAWCASRGDDVVPLIGARTPAQVASAVRALDVTLTADDLAAIDAAAPPEDVAGTRYPPDHMAALDSERDAS